jgi:hypothetical protein
MSTTRSAVRRAAGPPRPGARRRRAAPRCTRRTPGWRPGTRRRRSASRCRAASRSRRRRAPRRDAAAGRPGRGDPAFGHGPHAGRRLDRGDRGDRGGPARPGQGGQAGARAEVDHVRPGQVGPLGDHVDQGGRRPRPSALPRTRRAPPGILERAHSATPALAAVEAIGLPHRVIRQGPVRSLAEAARARGVAPADVVKTMVVRRGEDDFLFVLVPGDRTISWPKLRALLGVSRLSMPDAEVARQVTSPAWPWPRAPMRSSRCWGHPWPTSPTRRRLVASEQVRCCRAPSRSAGPAPCRR